MEAFGKYICYPLQYCRHLPAGNPGFVPVGQLYQTRRPISHGQNWQKGKLIFRRHVQGSGNYGNPSFTFKKFWFCLALSPSLLWDKCATFSLGASVLVLRWHHTRIFSSGIFCSFLEGIGFLHTDFNHNRQPWFRDCVIHLCAHTCHTLIRGKEANMMGLPRNIIHRDQTATGIALSLPQV